MALVLIVLSVGDEPQICFSYKNHRMVVMVEFSLKVNEKQGTAYLPKEIRNAFGLKLKLLPNAEAAAIYREGSDPARVIRSLEHIIENLRLLVEADEK